MQLQGTKLNQVTEKLHIPYTVKKRLAIVPGTGKSLTFFYSEELAYKSIQYDNFNIYILGVHFVIICIL